MSESLSFGKATKRSRYGPFSKDRMRRTVWSANVCSKAGLHYHLIDSEWKKFYMLPYEAQDLVVHSQDLKTIFTFSTRHTNCLSLIKQTVNTVGTDNICLNLVAGNPAYLGSRELRRSSLRTLISAVKFVRKNYEDIRVFVGTEGLSSRIIELCMEYDLTPFLLLDRGIEEEVPRIEGVLKNREVGLYFPFMISENYPRLLRDILYRLSGYIMRRRWVRNEILKMGYDPSVSTLKAVIQEKKPLSSKFIESDLGTFLKEAASNLTIYGDQDRVIKTLRALRKIGITTMMGLPIKENEEQILQLGECNRRIT